MYDSLLNWLPNTAKPLDLNIAAYPLSNADAAMYNAAVNGGGVSYLDAFKNFLSGAIGTTDNPGWGQPALSALSGLGSAYLGMQQYNLARRTLDESRRQYDQNYSAQRNLTNARLQDRQRARVASNPYVYQSVSDYMQQYGVR